MKKLFLTFWHIGLDNLPVGVFVHRRLMPDEARELIENARHQKTLSCVSHDDLLAPYKQREVTRYKDLCEVLTRDFGISLSINNFISATEDGGEPLYSINPLTGIEVGEGRQLVVVNCCYATPECLDDSGIMDFVVAPDSVAFSLFSAKEDDTVATHTAELTMPVA